MNWKSKIFICFLLLVLMPSNVFAVTFHSIGDATTAVVNKISNTDAQKYTNDYNGRTRYDAYCADQGTTFTSSQNFSRVDRYSTEKHCSYTLDGRNNNAYCNRMVARVIQVAREQINGNDNLKWRWAQMSVWAYLGHHSDSFTLRNNYAYGSVVSATDVNYAAFSSVIREAAKRYIENGDDAGIGYDVSNEIGLNVSDSNFYFVPGNGSCSGGGYYLTKNFTIKNNSNTKRRFIISVNVNSETTSNPVYICSKDENAESCSSVTKSTEINAYGEKQFYLRSASSNVLPGVTLRVDLVPYTEHKNVSIPDTAYFENTKNQNMIVYIPNGSDDVSLRGHKEARYGFITLSHETCEGHPNDKIGEENTYPAGELPEGKSCVNNLITPGGDKRAPDKKKYEVNYANCNCTTVELDGGKKVNVRIYENTSFRFGILNPTIVYPGGGLRFAKKGEGITTDYVSNITWRYVDYNADNMPYYYNPNNLSDNSVSDEMHNQINDIVRNMINDKLDLKFSTVDSNTGEDVSIMISNQLNKTETTHFVPYNEHGAAGREYIVVTVKTDDNGMSMNHAYLSIDGKVSYDAADGYPVDAGNSYYVPIKYGNSKFPFNISEEANLSALNNGGYKFRYIADCEVPVAANPNNPEPQCEENCDPEFFDKAINYRSVDLANPFPRANNSTGEGIKENWKDWYTSSSVNKQRLKDTFNNYPNEPLYSINMNNELLSRIGNIDSFYANWSSVERNGFDSFLSDYGVDYSRASGSYCEINQFSSECDR